MHQFLCVSILVVHIFVTAIGSEEDIASILKKLLAENVAGASVQSTGNSPSIYTTGESSNAGSNKFANINSTSEKPVVEAEIKPLGDGNATEHIVTPFPQSMNTTDSQDSNNQSKKAQVVNNTNYVEEILTQGFDKTFILQNSPKSIAYKNLSPIDYAMYLILSNGEVVANDTVTEYQVKNETESVTDAEDDIFLDDWKDFGFFNSETNRNRHANALSKLTLDINKTDIPQENQFNIFPIPKLMPQKDILKTDIYKQSIHNEKKSNKAKNKLTRNEYVKTLNEYKKIQQETKKNIKNTMENLLGMIKTYFDLSTNGTYNRSKRSSLEGAVLTSNNASILETPFLSSNTKNNVIDEESKSTVEQYKASEQEQTTTEDKKTGPENVHSVNTTKQKALNSLKKTGAKISNFGQKVGDTFKSLFNHHSVKHNTSDSENYTQNARLKRYFQPYIIIDEMTEYKFTKDEIPNNFGYLTSYNKSEQKKDNDKKTVKNRRSLNKSVDGLFVEEIKVDQFSDVDLKENTKTGKEDDKEFGHSFIHIYSNNGSSDIQERSIKKEVENFKYDSIKKTKDVAKKVNNKMSDLGMNIKNAFRSKQARQINIESSILNMTHDLTNNLDTTISPNDYATITQSRLDDSFNISKQINSKNNPQKRSNLDYTFEHREDEVKEKSAGKPDAFIKKTGDKLTSFGKDISNAFKTLFARDIKKEKSTKLNTSFKKGIVYTTEETDSIAAEIIDADTIVSNSETRTNNPKFARILKRANESTTKKDQIISNTAETQKYIKDAKERNQKYKFFGDYLNKTNFLDEILNDSPNSKSTEHFEEQFLREIIDSEIMKLKLIKQFLNETKSPLNFNEILRNAFEKLLNKSNLSGGNYGSADMKNVTEDVIPDVISKSARLNRNASEIPEYNKIVIPVNIEELSRYIENIDISADHGEPLPRHRRIRREKHKKENTSQDKNVRDDPFRIPLVIKQIPYLAENEADSRSMTVNKNNKGAEKHHGPIKGRSLEEDYNKAGSEPEKSLLLTVTLPTVLDKNVTCVDINGVGSGFSLKYVGIGGAIIILCVLLRNRGCCCKLFMSP